MPSVKKTNNRVKFPLTMLPILVSEEVLKNFDCIELLEFSTLAKWTPGVVSRVARTATPKIDIEISNDCAVKFYNGVNDTEHVLLWCIGNPDISGKSVPLRSARFAETMRITPKRVTKRQGEQEKPKFVCKTSDRGTALTSVLSHLLCIFPQLQIQDLVLNSPYEFDLEAGLAPLKTVKNLIINCPLLNDNAKILMEQLTITNRYVNKTGSNMGRGIQYNINCSEEIFSVNSVWMDPAKLSQLNCAKTHLLSSRITARQMEKYLLDWKNTDKHNKVQIMEVDMRTDAEKINFGRLGARVYDRYSRPPKITLDGNRTDCSDFLDIDKRDGSVGSIWVRRNKVVFLAWAELVKNGAVV